MSDLARELSIKLFGSRLHVFTSSAFIYPPNPSQYQSIPQSPAHPPAIRSDTNPSSPPNSQTTARESSHDTESSRLAIQYRTPDARADSHTPHTLPPAAL